MTNAESTAGARWPAAGQFASAMMRRERPRVVVKADLLPAVSVLSLVGLLGLPIGWAWSRLAPSERVRVLPGDELVPLQLESWHRFDGLVIYLLLGLAAGVITGVGVWFLRERRGPVILMAAVAGSALAGWLGLRMGEAFVQGLYPVTGAPAVGDVLERAPVLESAWVLLAQPLATALVYGILAAWNGRDDLGRRLG